MQLTFLCTSARVSVESSSTLASLCKFHIKRGKENRAFLRPHFCVVFVVGCSLSPNLTVQDMEEGDGFGSQDVDVTPGE